MTDKNKDSPETSKPEKGKGTDCIPDELQASTPFHTALTHLYRGEMHRMTVWRSRLDTTTHWAIILTIGLTTFCLGSVTVPHYVMLVGLTFNTMFMVIEGRRYQHLHHAKWRMRLLEQNYFAAQLSGAARPVSPTWRAQLTADLQRPHVTISLAMGSQLRLRRNYLMLFYFITAVWIAKLFVHPQNPSNFGEFYRRLAVGGFLPSWFVAATAVFFVVGATVLGVLTPSEEALERWSSEEHFRIQSAAVDEDDKA